jgi:hydroxymethylglutaryl-CoA lyase
VSRSLIRITDVSPRDGLQNERGVIDTTDKADLVLALAEAGVDEIEVTSFVSPKWVPQLGDATALLDLIASRLSPHRSSQPMLSALVPNERGMDGLLQANLAAAKLERGWAERGNGSLVRKASLFTAASETFCKKNTNATIAETIDRFKPVISRAREHGLLIRGYISCVIACPFEGPIAPNKVADVAEQLAALGVDEIDLGDTIGVGTPETTKAMLDAVITRVGDAWLGERAPGMPGLVMHLHDTFGRAADCVRAALACGVRSFDGSVAGLGGCPYASTPTTRAPGNIDTALLVRTVRDSGFDTHVDLHRLDEAARLARSVVESARRSADSQGGAS